LRSEENDESVRRNVSARHAENAVRKRELLNDRGEALFVSKGRVTVSRGVTFNEVELLSQGKKHYLKDRSTMSVFVGRQTDRVKGDCLHQRDFLRWSRGKLWGGGGSAANWWGNAKALFSKENGPIRAVKSFGKRSPVR